MRQGPGQGSPHPSMVPNYYLFVSCRQVTVVTLPLGSSGWARPGVEPQGSLGAGVPAATPPTARAERASRRPSCLAAEHSNVARGGATAGAYCPLTVRNSHTINLSCSTPPGAPKGVPLCVQNPADSNSGWCAARALCTSSALYSPRARLADGAHSDTGRCDARAALRSQCSCAC